MTGVIKNYSFLQLASVFKYASDYVNHTGGGIMSFFKDKEELQAILSELWDRILRDEALVSSLSTVKILVQFDFKDFATSLFIDNRGETPCYFWDKDEKADVMMILSSDTAHLFWMESLNVPLALGSRKIIAKGSIQKALKLLPALKPAFALYPQVLHDMGKKLPESKTGKKNSSSARKFFKKRKNKKAWDLTKLPDVPLPLTSSPRTEKPATVSLSEKKPSGKNKDITEKELLAVMYRIRCFEEHLKETFASGELPTEAIHLSIGQEAVAAGVCAQLRDSDYLNTTHRGHGHIIAKGADLQGMMAELYGRRTGLCSGKGGSMHVTDSSRGILGANGIVGAGYLLAMGAGFSLKNVGGDDISVVIAGDGSVNQGMFHEAMNMMSLFHLPVLVVVENNLYGEFTSVENHSAVTEMYRRAEAYNIEAHRFNGNDVREVFNGVGDIIEAIRQDRRPRLIELMTYRWRGHMEGDTEAYRPEKEKEKYINEDPIISHEMYLSEEGTMTPADIEDTKKKVVEEVKAAVAFARDSEEPELTSLMDSVYIQEDSSLWNDALIPPPECDSFLSVSAAINRALEDEMNNDAGVFLWGEDVTLGGYFNVTDGLVDTFGTGRIIDTPISENAIVGGAVGAAMTGMRPVAEILFGDFLSCCMDPILNQAAKLRYMTGGQASIPLTIRTPLGSGIGMAAQHSQSMERFFAGIPGLIVAAPSDAYSAKGLLKSAIRSNNPVLFFEHKLLYPLTGPVPEEEYFLPLGKARVVQTGNYCTIVSWLMGTGIALEAAKILEEKGLDVEVIDLTTLYPLDYTTILESVSKTGKLVVVEEGNSSFGIGAEIIAGAAIGGFGLLKSPPLRLGAAECPVPYAKNLEQGMLVTPEAVAREIAAL